MRDELVVAQPHQVADVRLDLRHRDRGQPDAGAIVVDPCREERPLPGNQPADVPHRPVQHQVGAVDRLGEPDAVLVREQVEVGVEVRLVGEVQRAEAAPVHEVVADRLRRLGPERAIGDVGHQVQAERRDPGHARVLDAGVAGAALPARVGLEHDAAPLDADRHAVLEHHLRQPDARDVARRHEPRQQAERAVRGTAGRGVEHALGLVRVAVGRHHHPRARELERNRHPLTPDPICVDTKCRWKATNSATAGAASTHAPARIAPNGFAARAETVLM